MHGLEPDAWHDFFVAVAGIGAALGGLVFVAFSTNLAVVARVALLAAAVVGAARVVADASAVIASGPA